jgi:hypothetical protein
MFVVVGHVHFELVHPEHGSILNISQALHHTGTIHPSFRSCLSIIDMTLSVSVYV